LNLENLTTSAHNLKEANQLIEELVGIVLAQQAEIEALKEIIADLQSKNGRSSKNSSKSPSSDSPEQRKKRKQKPRSSRHKGGQPGHKKHERALLPEDQVDEIHHYFPDSQCRCGNKIEINEEPTCRHQVFDLPEVKYTVTEHQLFSGKCVSCGKTHSAHLPAWVPSGQMGAGLISTILLLSGQFHLSMRQIQAYLNEQWTLNFSTGAISQAQGKALPWLGNIYRQIGDKARRSHVAHADETRHFRHTTQRWLWAMVTPSLCFFMVHFSRGKKAANELLGSFKGYLVTDHYAGYNDFPKERRQLCWAHLLRHFVDISERKGKAGEIGQRLLFIAHLVFRTQHRLGSDPEKHQIYQRRMKRLRKSFQKTLERGSQLVVADRTANQCRHLLKDEMMCWTFLKDSAIPLTNNLAERAIRPYVIWRKLSFASQSYQGDQFRPMILTILGTTQKLGMSTAKLLRQVCTEGLTKNTVSVRLPLDSNTLPSP
jgi:transposase